MRLEHEFIKLPYLFDVERLQYELAQFSESDWIPHPNHLTGNMSIPLISAGGGVNDDMCGQMMMTECLKKSPYLQQVMSTFNQVFGRSRLMRLEPSCVVPPHVDIHYHWFNRVRIHIPIVTNPQVIFHCADKKVHMAEGESWLFDAWKMHQVTNDSKETRVHLVLDTSGDANFWQMAAQSAYLPEGKKATLADQKIEFDESKIAQLKFEKYNTDVVMAPGEVDYLVQDLVDDVTSCASNDAVKMAEFVARANRFKHEWRSYWSLYGDEPQHLQRYSELVHQAAKQDESVRLGSVDVSAEMVFHARVLAVVLNPNARSGLAATQSDTVAANQLPPTNTGQDRASRPASQGIFKPENNPVVSRNSPCTCGSGLKYKHCCGKVG